MFLLTFDSHYIALFLGSYLAIYIYITLTKLKNHSTLPIPIKYGLIALWRKISAERWAFFNEWMFKHSKEHLPLSLKNMKVTLPMSILSWEYDIPCLNGIAPHHALVLKKGLHLWKALLVWNLQLICNWQQIVASTQTGAYPLFLLALLARASQLVEML